MTAEITEEELILCLTPTPEGQECCFDEVLLLLGDLCESEEAKKLVEYYVDEYYRCFEADCDYIRELECRVQELEDRIKKGEKYGRRNHKRKKRT